MSRWYSCRKIFALGKVTRTVFLLPAGIVPVLSEKVVAAYADFQQCALGAWQL